MTAWLDRLRIDKDGRRLVGMQRGMYTLTADPGGEYIVWFYDKPLYCGAEREARALYEGFAVCGSLLSNLFQRTSLR